MYMLMPAPMSHRGRKMSAAVQLRRHGERRRAWNKREDRAAERQKRRIGCTNAARRGGQHDGGEDQPNEDFKFSHVTESAAILADLVDRTPVLKGDLLT